MRKLILAAALIAPLAATAQMNASDDMMESLTMLEASTKNALEGYGIETDVTTLSIAQLGQIHGVISGEEAEGQKKGRIEAIIATPAN